MSKKLISFKSLVEEWNYEKNTNISPEDFVIGSGKKIWWKCKKCNYEWEAVIRHRTRGMNKGCPS